MKQLSFILASLALSLDVNLLKKIHVCEGGKTALTPDPIHTSISIQVIRVPVLMKLNRQRQMDSCGRGRECMGKK